MRRLPQALMLMLSASACGPTSAPPSPATNTHATEEEPPPVLDPLREPGLGTLLPLAGHPQDEPIALTALEDALLLADRTGQLAVGWPPVPHRFSGQGPLTALARDPAGGVWLAGVTGLVHLEGSTTRPPWNWALPDGSRPALRGLCVTSDGRLAGAVDHGIVTLDPVAGTAVWLAGSPEAGFRDGKGHDARFLDPEGVLEDEGRLLVCDAGNHALREVWSDGTSKTLAGGRPGRIDGPLDRARLRAPRGISRHARLGLLILDTGNHAIRTLRDGRLRTLAGDGLPGLVGGPLPDVRLTAPMQAAGSWLLGADGQIWQWQP